MLNPHHVALLRKLLFRVCVHGLGFRNLGLPPFHDEAITLEALEDTYLATQNIGHGASSNIVPEGLILKQVRLVFLGLLTVFIVLTTRNVLIKVLKPTHTRLMPTPVPDEVVAGVRVPPKALNHITAARKG